LFGAPAGPNWLCFALLVRLAHLHFECVSSFELRASAFPVSPGPAREEPRKIGFFFPTAEPGGFLVNACLKSLNRHLGQLEIGFVWHFRPPAFRRPSCRAGRARQPPVPPNWVRLTFPVPRAPGWQRQAPACRWRTHWQASLATRIGFVSTSTLIFSPRTTQIGFV